MIRSAKIPLQLANSLLLICWFLMGRSYFTRTLMVISLLAPYGVWGQSVQHPGTAAKPEPSAFATLQGVVRDVRSRVVADASVFLHAEDALILRERTNSAGAYRFASVRAGTYTLRAEKDGEGATIFGAVIFRPNESKTIDLTLAPPKTGQPNSATVRPEFFDEPH